MTDGPFGLERRLTLKAIRKLADWLPTAFVVVAVGLVAFMLAGPRLGWNTHPVLSGSMEPALPVGGIIVTQAVPVENIAVGDVVTLNSGDVLVTHRVVEILHREGDSKPWFRTKGDANQEADANILSPKGDLAPRVVAYVPEVGKLTTVTKDKTTFLLLVGIPVLLLLVVCAREIWQGVKEEKGKRKLIAGNVQGRE